MTPKVSIITLNWNSSLVTRECISSLLNIDYPNYDIILVDNNSGDNSVAAIKDEFPGIILLKNSENLGFAGGNNVGIRHALKNMAEYVLILNNDTVVEKSFLSEMIRTAAADERYGIVTCKMYYYDDPERIWYAGGTINRLTLKARHSESGRSDTDGSIHAREVSFVTGCCMLVRRSLIEATGMLDESFFTYAEDLDWSLRASKAGFKLIYVPSAKIWHRVGFSVRKNTLSGAGGTSTPLQYYLVNRNRIFVLRKHGNIINYICAGVLFVFRNLYVSAGLILLWRISKLKAMLKGIKDGIIMPV